MYDADLKHSVPTGYAECRPNNLDDNLPDYNRFTIDILELKNKNMEKKYIIKGVLKVV